jgi:type I restriction enzyme, S subunit
MELRAGYKRTEVGEIPVDWNVLRLDEITDPRRPISYGIVQTGPNVRNGVPCLRVVDINDGHIDKTELITTTKQISNSYSRTILKEGDLVMPLRGKVGDVAIIDNDLAGANLTRGVALIAVLPKQSGQFLRHLISASVTRRRLEQSMNGSALQEVPIATLRSFTLGLPSTLNEQKTAALILDDLDKVLDALDLLIVKKRNLKQAAMQQLLTGRTRLPGFGGEWHEITLGEIGECVIGLTYKPENVVDHGLLVLRSSNVQDGHLSYDDNVYVNVEVSERLYTRLGDVLVCVRNGSRALIGKCALINEAAAGLTFGAFMSVFRTKYWRFIFHTFQAESIQRQIRDNIGATINQITNKDMKSLRVMLPPDDEQLAISEILDDMDAEIASLEQRLAKTRDLKQAMMQDLLTGRTRLL